MIQPHTSQATPHSADALAILVAMFLAATFKNCAARIAATWQPQTYREHLQCLFMTIMEYYHDHRNRTMPSGLPALLNDMCQCAHRESCAHARQLMRVCTEITNIPELADDPAVTIALVAARTVLIEVDS